jgi:hypothetical protein
MDSGNLLGKVTLCSSEVTSVLLVHEDFRCDKFRVGGIA